jgi:hypothetical protein
MNGWDPDQDWEWDIEDDADDDAIFSWADSLADCFFLSDNDYLPMVIEDYNMGFLEPEDWEPLVTQLDDLVDLDALLVMATAIQPLLQLPGLPTELLEDPLGWLEAALRGSLPPEPSGRKVGSRRLVQLALAVIHLAQELPDTARAAVHAWAEVQRSQLRREAIDADDESWQDMPPAVTGFSMMIAMSLILWPHRAEGIELPPGFAQPELYHEIMRRWESLPDGLVEESEELGEAEAFFAQGQLAHLLAQMDTPIDDAAGNHDLETARAYSRLSRAILWVHNQCRHCPERTGMTCRAAGAGPDQPLPLLDVAGQIANTGGIVGCTLQLPGM